MNKLITDLKQENNQLYEDLEKCKQKNDNLQENFSECFIEKRNLEREMITLEQQHQELINQNQELLQAICTVRNNQILKSN